MPNSNGNRPSLLSGSKARVLITGGAGFFGSHLAEALLKKNHDVFILDDLPPGSIENIRHLKATSALQYWIDSVKNKHFLAELVDQCDIILHLPTAIVVPLLCDT